MARPRRPRTVDHRRATQQLRALAHPLRLKLLESFAQGRRTTMQVAAELQEPPTRLYHHVNALERAGLLKLRETRPKRGTTEKYYEVVRPQLEAGGADSLRGKRGEMLRGLAMQVIEESRRELLSALAGMSKSKLGTGSDAIEPPLAARMVISVSPKQQLALRRRLVRALQDVGREFKSRASAPARRWAVTVTLAPTVAAAAVAPQAPRRARRRTPRKSS